MSRIPKRPLENVDNTVDAMDSDGHSIDFTLARINDNSGKSHIPVPVSTIKRNPSLNLQHINNLIGLNQTLKESQHKQSKLTSHNSHINASSMPPTSQFSSGKKNDGTLDRDIKHQVQRNKKLADELKALGEKSDNLEVDLVELKRQQKKLYHRLSDVKSDIISNKRRFGYLEDSIMTNVLNKERLINVKIKEHSQKLDNDLKNLKFELNNELKIAQEFKDEDIEAKIKQLNDKKDKLEIQLKTVIDKNKHQLELEQIEIDKQLTRKLQSKVEESNLLNHQYKSQVTVLNDLKLEHDEIIKLIKEEESNNQSIARQIKTIKDSGNNFTTIKSNLLKRITELEENLKVAHDKESKADLHLQKISNQHKEITNKVSQHSKTRRILENAIMNYETKRIYINLPTSIPTKANTFKVANQVFEFSKVFNNLSNDKIIDEFEYFTKSSLKQSTTLSYIFCGESNPDLVKDTIFHSYKIVQSLNLSLKAFEVHQDSVEDLLDSHRRINAKLPVDPLMIPSQSMIIDNPQNFQNILNDINTSNDKVFVMTMNDDKISSNLVFIDISNNGYQLTPSAPIMQSVMKFSSSIRSIYLVNSCNSINTEFLKALSNL